MASSESSTERERVIIEASILAATLAFIVAQLKELTSPAFVGAISYPSAFFIASAISATVIMWRARDRKGNDRWEKLLSNCEFLSFILGLILLFVMFTLMAYSR
jgi:hypothetical protein